MCKWWINLNTHEHVIDEASFQTALESEVSYLRTPALKHDIDCVSAIIRLRKGRSPHRLEDCRAVFVTQNRGLTRASRYFFSSGYSANISPCITDYELTSLLWLKLPSIVPDLPMKMLIANCYAAVQPSKELWTKYLQEVERLNNLGQCTPDEYYALRYSLYAKDALMKCTLGVEKAFVEGTVHDVLAAARERIVTEAKNAAKKELATEQKKRVDAEQTANAAISKISDVQNRVAHFSASTASVIVWGVQAFMAIVLLIGILISFVGVGTMGTTSRITATVVTVCYLTWLFCSFMGIWSGLTIREKLDMMQARLESSINSLITRWLGFERQHDNLQH